MKKGSTQKRIQIELSHEQCDYVAERAAEYGSASEYMRDLIQRDAAIPVTQRLEELALEGLRSGPPLPMDPDFFAKLEDRIRRKARATKQSTVKQRTVKQQTVDTRSKTGAKGKKTPARRKKRA